MTARTHCILLLATALVLLLAAGSFAEDNKFVGSKACSECHEDAYKNFHTYAKKAHSAQSVKRMAPKLTAEELKECYHCHTTGYGQPGGFVSYEKTPGMGDAGCEVCHGPGYNHIEEGGDTDLIHNPTLEDCEVCHSKERVASFDFKPLLHGGAH